MRPEERSVKKIAKIRFHNQRVNTKGVDDRRNWYTPEHRTKPGYVFDKVEDFTGAGMLWNLGNILGRKLRRK